MILTNSQYKDRDRPVRFDKTVVIYGWAYGRYRVRRVGQLNRNLDALGMNSINPEKVPKMAKIKSTINGSTPFYKNPFGRLVEFDHCIRA